MPARLRPSAPMAPDAILVGDPGRALALAQLLMKQPKMSHHARGLWGYTGETPAGSPLTVQATGMGAPSAAIVLEDLAELGIRRVVRVGTCLAAPGRATAGEAVLVQAAIGADGVTFALAEGPRVQPDPVLTAALNGAGRPVVVLSGDRYQPGAEPSVSEPAVMDLQSAAVLGVGRELGIAAAALLVVERVGDGDPISDEDLVPAMSAAGERAAGALSSST